MSYSPPSEVLVIVGVFWFVVGILVFLRGGVPSRSKRPETPRWGIRFRATDDEDARIRQRRDG
jgi:hypothetical protein